MRLEAVERGHAPEQAAALDAMRQLGASDVAPQWITLDVVDDMVTYADHDLALDPPDPGPRQQSLDILPPRAQHVNTAAGRTASSAPGAVAPT